MATTTQNPLEQVESFISRYVVMGEAEKKVVATWVLHTWTFEGFAPDTTPYLYIYSAQKGSGKTLLGLDLMEVLARNPIGVASTSAAGLFRVVESMQPTLLIDEVDTIFNGARHEDLRGAINSGYRRGGKVLRVEGTEPRFFRTFCPKALIGIDNNMMPDTIRDRCLPIHMHRATEQEREAVQPFFHYKIEDEIEALQDTLAAWALENSPKARDYEPKVIPGLSPRQWEICRPLLQLGHVLRCEPEIRKALTKLLAEVEERRTPEQDMLELIRDHFQSTGKDRAMSADILTALAEDPRFAAMNGKALAVKLAGFDVKGQTIRVGNTTGRGYYRRSFEDAWSRYL